MKPVFDVKDPEAFVWSQVAKFRKHTEMDAEDLKQEGLLVLAEALTTFVAKPERGTFATYLRGAIKHKMAYLISCERMRRRGRGRADSREVFVSSMDEVVVSDSSKEQTLHDCLGAVDPNFERIERRQLHAMVKKQLEKLPTRSLEMVERRAEGESFVELGKSFGLNAERVRQIVKDAHETTRRRVEIAAR